MQQFFALSANENFSRVKRIVCDHPDYLALGYVVPTNDRAIQPSATVRVMTFNTKQGCADAQQIVRTIQSEHVEILAMQEVSSGLLDRLHDAGIEDYLPYSVSAQLTWHDNGGVNVLYSVHPLQETTQDLIPIESSSIPAATVDFNGRKVRFGSVHRLLHDQAIRDYGIKVWIP